MIARKKEINYKISLKKGRARTKSLLERLLAALQTHEAYYVRFDERGQLCWQISYELKNCYSGSSFYYARIAVFPVIKYQ
jgi:hypothetical protein